MQLRPLNERYPYRVDMWQEIEDSQTMRGWWEEVALCSLDIHADEIAKLLVAKYHAIVRISQFKDGQFRPIKWKPDAKPLTQQWLDLQQVLNRTKRGSRMSDRTYEKQVMIENKLHRIYGLQPWYDRERDQWHFMPVDKDF